MSADQKLFFTNISSASLSNSNSWNIIVTHLISENIEIIIRHSKNQNQDFFKKNINNRKSDLQKITIQNLGKYKNM